MAIEAKILLLKSLEKYLSTKISSADMEIVLSVLSDQLMEYDIIQTSFTDNETDDLLNAYIAAIQIQGRSKKTIERYKYLIQQMMHSIKIPTRNITVYHLRKYLSEEKARGISDCTLEGVRQVFSAYFNWLYKEHLIDSNPMMNLGAIKCQKKIKSTYSEVDIEKMKFCCKTLRDRAIISFLMSTGCRISEMTQLNRTDVDLVNLECLVLGKGNKERTVFLDSVTSMLIKDYLDQRTDDFPALFIGKGTERLKPGGVRCLLKKIQKQANIETNVHPHKFRRTLATNLIRHGMPIQEVASILGHDKLDTTMKYIVLDKTDVKNSYKKYTYTH